VIAQKLLEGKGGDDIRVYQKNPASPDQVSGMGEGTCGTQEAVLSRNMNPHRGGLESLGKDVGMVVCVDDDVIEAKLCKVMKPSKQGALPKEGDQRFWAGLGEGAQARPHACCENKTNTVLHDATV
jgi:hypothetical protein